MSHDKVMQQQTTHFIQCRAEANKDYTRNSTPPNIS